VPVGALGAVAAALGDPTMPMRLVAAIGDVDSALPSFALWDLSRIVAASPALGAAFDAGVDDGLPGRIAALAAGADPAAAAEAARFAAALDAFLERFGSRGPNEWDLRSDTWETRPVLALVLIDRMRGMGDDAAPMVRHDERHADRAALTAEVAAALADTPEVHQQFLLAVRSAMLHMAGRERTKTTIIKVLHEVRMAVRELGGRHGLALEEVCMLTDGELDAFVADPAAMRPVVAERLAAYRELFDLEPPFIVDRVVPPLGAWPRRSDAPVAVLAPGASLTGVPGCPGVATGRARVVLDPADPFALEPGDVLVAPMTDPAWTPLFVPAAAVVVDVGAQVSHAVIVSRELGIPCVVSVTGATRRIPDGALVRVDGTSGTVTVVG
jgi:phosphohistidine swiveling domain-containing protein